MTWVQVLSATFPDARVAAAALEKLNVPNMLLHLATCWQVLAEPVSMVCIPVSMACGSAKRLLAAVTTFSSKLHLEDGGADGLSRVKVGGSRIGVDGAYRASPDLNVSGGPVPTIQERVFESKHPYAGGTSMEVELPPSVRLAPISPSRCVLLVLSLLCALRAHLLLFSLFFTLAFISVRLSVSHPVLPCCLPLFGMVCRDCAIVQSDAGL